MTTMHVLFAVNVGLVVPWGSFQGTGPSIKLRLAAPSIARYRIDRQWRAQPKASGNGMQNHVFTARLAVSKSQEDLKVEQFSGVDLAGIETKHLRDIASEVRSIRFAQVTNELGVAGAKVFQGGQNGGWAGMMAQKALGLYEVGPFDFFYPIKPVRVGDEWQRPVLAGNESFYVPDYAKKFSGNWVTCRCRLLSIDVEKHVAKVGFTWVGRPKATIKRSVLSPEHEEAYELRATGTWTIDTRDGLPLRFEASRTVRSSRMGVVEIEQTKTSAVRLP